MNDKEHIESFIRKSLDELEVQPAIPSFELTMKKLEAAQKEKRKRRFFFWFFAGIAVFGFGSLAVFYPYGKTNDHPQANAITAEEMKKIENGIVNYIQAEGKKAELQQQKNTSLEPIKTKGNLAVNEKIKNTGSSSFHNTPAVTNGATPTPYAATEPGIINPITADPYEKQYIFLELYKTTDLPSGAQPDTSLKNAALVQQPILPAEPATEKKKDLVWYAGAGFTPQLARYNFPPVTFDEGYPSFYDSYRAARIDEARAVWSYKATMQSAFLYKEKWMFSVGLGYQVFRYVETVKYISTDSTPGSPAPPPPVLTTNLTPTGSSNADAFVTTSTSESIAFKNTFRYAQLNVSGSRLFRFGNLGLNTGVDLSAARLLPSRVLTVEGENSYTYRQRYSGIPLNKWIYTTGVHVGVVKEIGRMQLQAGPNGFYNLNSMFGKGYIVSQKPCGLGFDLNILIRLN